MATLQSIFIPTSPTSATLFNGTITNGSTQAITLAPRTIFAIATSGQTNIRFGNVTKVPTATAADWPVFADAVQEWETGEEFDQFSIYNGSGSTVTYWVYVLSRN